MTRFGSKATILALSLAATVGGWAVLAGRERVADLAGTVPIATTALATRPDVAQQPATLTYPTAAPTPTPGAANTTNSAVRPLARTRSSR